MAQFLVETLFNSPGATWQLVGTAVASNTTGFTMPAGTRAGDFVIVAAAAVGTGAGGAAPRALTGLGNYAGYSVLVANLSTTTASTNTLIACVNNLPASNTGFISFNTGGSIAAGVVYVYRPVNVPTSKFLLDPIPANSNFVTTSLTKNSAPLPPPVTTIPQKNFIIVFGTKAGNTTPTAPAGYTNFTYQTNSSVAVMGAVTVQQGSGTITPGQFGSSNSTSNSCSSATVVLRTRLMSAIVPFFGNTGASTPTVYSQNAVFTVASGNSVITSELPGTFPISISGGTNSAFSVNGSAFTNSASAITITSPGGTVNVAVSQTSTNTAPGTNNTSTATLTVGDKSNTFNLISARAYTRTTGTGLSATFNYDANVTNITIYAIGGGGGGNLTAHGGSGGTFVSRTVASVNSTASVVVTNGQGADSTFGPVDGSNATVTIAGATVALARGGISANSTAGGVAVTTGSIGNSIFAGGNGGTGNTNFGGGGGGAGGYTGVGGNGGANGVSGTAGTNDAAGGGGGSLGSGYGGGGGGGTGASGAGAAGAGGGANSAGGRGGGEGSPDTLAASGSAGSLISGGSGGAGGGGGGGSAGNRSQGGDGIVRIIW